MLYGLFVYAKWERYCNIWDYIQSLAAKQFLPHVDKLLYREELDQYTDEEIKIISNWWFMHSPLNRPPSKNIIPLFIAFHLNEKARHHLLQEKSIQYFKKHWPIWCRDIHTKNLLDSKWVNTYYSSCLTLTLWKTYKSETRTDNIYIVDIPGYKKSTIKEKIKRLLIMLNNPINIIHEIRKKFKRKEEKKINIKKIISEDLLKKAIQIHHFLPKSEQEEENFKIAEDLLKKYAEAKLVITGKIHCALPCLALWTPVIFINAWFDSIEDSCRFEWIIDLFNTITVDKDWNISTNFWFTWEKIDLTTIIKNPKTFEKYIPSLIERCEKFING